MKRHLTLLLSFIGVSSMILTSCDERDQLPVIPFYSVEVESGHLFAPDWVFATDENGEALDAKRLTAGSSVALYGPIEPGRPFTLHFLYVYEGAGHNYFGVISYTAVPFKGTSHLVAAPPPPVLDKDHASVEIENLPASGEGHVIHTQLSFLTGPLREDFGPFPVITFPVWATSDVLVSSLIDDSYQYALLEDVEPYTTRTVSLRPVEIPLPISIADNPIAVGIQLTGYYAGDNTMQVGYVNSSYSGRLAAIPTMGYIQGFDKYRTGITYRSGPIAKTYVKRGDPIEEVPEFDSPEFVVDSEYLNTFSGTVSIPYHMAALTFSRESSYATIHWSLSLRGNGDNAPLNFSMKSIPSAIRSAHPDFFIHNLTLNSVTVTQFLDDFTYDGVLENFHFASNPYFDPFPSYPSSEYFIYQIHEF